MGMSYEDILARTKVEGKDSLDQYAQLRGDYIRDICREMTTAFNFSWLNEVITVTSAGDGVWVDLPTSTLKICGFSIDNKPVQPISETMYFKSITTIVPVTAGQKTYYRERWNDNTKRKQITTVGVDAGVTITILVKKFFDDPGKMPPELEEAVVQGTLFKFLTFMEGEDTSVAVLHQQRYAGIMQQFFHIADAEILDDDDDRVRTNDEITNFRAMPYLSE